MKTWLYEHSLSLILVALYLTFQTLAVLTTESLNSDFFLGAWQGHADDTLGALLIVVCTKFFRERGKKPSAESR